ncbi:MAG: hypothetical protein ACETWB_09820 [Anaerolineae bacterium]
MEEFSNLQLSARTHYRLGRGRAVIPRIALTLILQRDLLRGLTLGAVKG